LGFHCWWNRPVQVNEWLFGCSWSVFILGVKLINLMCILILVRFLKSCEGIMEWN
jgi:hypothetical protein